MAKMTKSEILATAKKQVVGDLLNGKPFADLDAVQIGDYAYAIPTVVNGEDRWVTVELTAKDKITDDEGNKVDYTPEIEIARWEWDKADKAERKAERDRKHAETVARAEKRKAEAKAKAEARKAKTEDKGE